MIIGRRILNQFFVAISFASILLFFLYLPTLVRLGFRADRTVNVYTFTEFISPEAVKAFEKEYGIRVNLQFFESNEELYAKFKINNGAEYDVITPSDYMVEDLKKDGLLKKIDYTQMPNTDGLSPQLLHHFFDPDNEYSVPLAWSVYGIIYDKHNVTNPNNDIGLDYIFKKPEEMLRQGLVKKPYKICIFDDPRDVVLVTAYHLFGKIHNINEQEFAAIERLLVDQKQWVECYTNFGLRYFLEGNIISFALTVSRFAHRLLDIENGRFGFKIPKKGSFWVIENFAIPALSTKTIWAQQFINFMISYKYSLYHFKQYGGNPVNQRAYKEVKETSANDLQYFPRDDEFEKLMLMHNEISVEKTEDIWLRVKTA